MPSYSFGPYLVRHPRRANSSRLSEPQKSNFLVRRLVFISLTFFLFSTNLCALPVRDVTRTPSPVSSQTIVTFLSDTFVRLRAPALTPASMFAPNQPICRAKRHEPKSPGHYVTNCFFFFFFNSNTESFSGQTFSFLFVNTFSCASVTDKKEQIKVFRIFNLNILNPRILLCIL